MENHRAKNNKDFLTNDIETTAAIMAFAVVGTKCEHKKCIINLTL